MKASPLKLGLALQQFLMQQGSSLEALAAQMQMNPDSLSNIIHGRRRFRDVTLVKLAETPLFKQHHFTLRRLKALRALDDYTFDELVMALAEGIRLGELETTPQTLFDQLRAELQLSEADQPKHVAEKQHQLLKAIS
jgi:hypothetical protein